MSWWKKQNTVEAQTALFLICTICCSSTVVAVINHFTGYWLDLFESGLENKWHEAELVQYCS